MKKKTDLPVMCFLLLMILATTTIPEVLGGVAGSTTVGYGLGGSGPSGFSGNGGNFYLDAGAGHLDETKPFEAAVKILSQSSAARSKGMQAVIRMVGMLSGKPNAVRFRDDDGGSFQCNEGEMYCFVRGRCVSSECADQVKTGKMDSNCRNNKMAQGNKMKGLWNVMSVMVDALQRKIHDGNVPDKSATYQKPSNIKGGSFLDEMMSHLPIQGPELPRNAPVQATMFAELDKDRYGSAAPCDRNRPEMYEEVDFDDIAGRMGNRHGFNDTNDRNGTMNMRNRFNGSDSGDFRGMGRDFADTWDVGVCRVEDESRSAVECCDNEVLCVMSGRCIPKTCDAGRDVIEPPDEYREGMCPAPDNNVDGVGMSDLIATMKQYFDSNPTTQGFVILLRDMSVSDFERYRQLVSLTSSRDLPDKNTYRNMVENGVITIDEVAQDVNKLVIATQVNNQQDDTASQIVAAMFNFWSSNPSDQMFLDVLNAMTPQMWEEYRNVFSKVGVNLPDKATYILNIQRGLVKVRDIKASLSLLVSYAVNSAGGNSGASGPFGGSGASGPFGGSGASGPFGGSGASGSFGGSGASGSFGGSGASGSFGGSGASGSFGGSGASGPFGGSGASGPFGGSGASGPFGGSGASGPFGGSGASGPFGGSGASGPVGDSGASGPFGASGASGPFGNDGASGPVGDSGASGPFGGSGASGPFGASGASGPFGDSGASGPSGASGASGPFGASGPSGASGASGPFGAIGPSGDSGAFAGSFGGAGSFGRRKRDTSSFLGSSATGAQTSSDVISMLSSLDDATWETLKNALITAGIPVVDKDSLISAVGQGTVDVQSVVSNVPTDMPAFSSGFGGNALGGSIDIASVFGITQTAAGNSGSSGSGFSGNSGSSGSGFSGNSGSSGSGFSGNSGSSGSGAASTCQPGEDICQRNSDCLVTYMLCCSGCCVVPEYSDASFDVGSSDVIHAIADAVDYSQYDTDTMSYQGFDIGFNLDLYTSNPVRLELPVNNTQAGDWEVSRDQGNTWNAVVDGAQVPPDSRLRFMPENNTQHGLVTIGVQALDENGVVISNNSLAQILLPVRHKPRLTSKTPGRDVVLTMNEDETNMIYNIWNYFDLSHPDADDTRLNFPLKDVLRYINNKNLPFYIKSRNEEFNRLYQERMQERQALSNQPLGVLVKYEQPPRTENEIGGDLIFIKGSQHAAVMRELGFYVYDHRDWADLVMLSNQNAYNFMTNMGRRSLMRASVNGGSGLNFPTAADTNKWRDWGYIFPSPMGESLIATDLNQFTFLPRRDKTGTFRFVLRPYDPKQFYYSDDPYGDGKTFIIKVVPANDAPQISFEADKDTFNLMDRDYRNYLLPHVPYDINTNDGFLASELVDRFWADQDSSSLGLAILKAQNTAIGNFQYKNPGQQHWQDISMTDADIPDIIKLVTSRAYDAVLDNLLFYGTVDDASKQMISNGINPVNATVLLIGPDTRVRYNPISGNTTWTRGQALRSTKFAFAAWDMTDNRTSGSNYSFSLPCLTCGGDSPLSFFWIMSAMHRLGCDGFPSSGKVENQCGMCGEDDRYCLDCAGVVNGGADWDKCGDCTGGTTGQAVDYRLDCAGQCGENVIITVPTMNGQHSECIPADHILTNSAARAEYILNRFCDGIWLSGARINKCGHCVGGSTGKGQDYGIDVCGVCNGDNSTCTDCDGVPGGSKQQDPCGQCLERTDSQWGAACVKIHSINPDLSEVGVAEALIIYGASLSNLQSPTCKLVHESTSQEIALQVLFFQARQSKIYVQVPGSTTSSDGGRYIVSCTLTNSDGNSNDLQIASDRFTLYAAPTVSAIVPSTINIGESVNGVIRGQNFLNQDWLACYTLIPSQRDRGFFGNCQPNRFGLIYFSGTFLNSSAIRCDLSCLSGVKVGKSINISVAFENLTRDDVDTTQGATFSINAQRPVISSVVLGKSMCRVNVIFDVNIAGPSSPDCSQFFSSVASFGTNPRCVTRSKRLVVMLGQGAVVRPGDTLTLQNNAIYAAGSTTPNYATGSGTVTRPQSSIPEVELMGPASVGSCDSFIIRVRYTAGLCGVGLAWNVTFADTVDLSNVTQAAQTDLEEMQSSLTGVHSRAKRIPVTADMGVPGYAYNFSATISNSLGEGEQAYLVISREVGDKPITVAFEPLQGNVRADRATRLGVRISTSDCFNGSLADVSVVWEVTNAAGVTFNPLPKPGRVAIPRNNLKGGRTYTIQATVSLSGDDSATTVATMDLTVPSQALKPRIRGTRGVVGSAADLVLDGSRSFDPDNSDETTYFTWSCKIVTTSSNGSETYDVCVATLGPGNYSTLDGIITRFVGQSGQLLTLPAGLLTPSDYMFTVTMAKGTRRASYSVYRRVKEGTPPSVNVPPGRGKVNPYDRFSLRATVTLPTATQAVVIWESMVEEGYTTVDLENYASIGNIIKVVDGPFKDRPFDLVLCSSAIPNCALPEGVSLKLRLTVQPTVGDSSYAETVVNTNAVPVGGALAVAPWSGEELKDKFTLSISGLVDDEDDLPLQLTFFKLLADGTYDELNGLPVQSQGDYEFQLSMLGQGSHRFGVEACDQNDACSIVMAPQLVNVSEPQSMSVNDLESALTTMTNNVKSGSEGDVAALLQFRNILGNIDTNSGNISSQALTEKTEALKEVVKSVVQNNINHDPQQSDRDTNVQVLDTVFKLAVSDGLSVLQQRQFQTSIRGVIGQMMTETEEEQALERRRRRRKRSVSNGGGAAVAMTESEAENLLNSYKLLYQSGNSRTLSTDFNNDVNNIIIGLCRGLSTADQAVVAENTIAVIKTHNRLFSGINNETLDVGCSGCTTTVNYTSTAVVGAEIENTYSTWNCSGNTQCYGLCIGSAHFPDDYLTITASVASPLISTRRSDVILLKFLNTETEVFETITNLTTPVTFDIPITGEVNTTQYSLECRHWTGSDWSQSECTSGEPIERNSTTYITCSCTVLGHFGVFEAAPVTTTTSAPTTEAQTTEVSTAAQSDLGGAQTTEASTDTVTSTSTAATTTTPAATVAGLSGATQVTVTITFNADFNAIIGQNKSDAIESFTVQIASFLGVNSSRIVNMDVRSGSIIVTFDLLAATSAAEPSLSAALATLQSSVNGNTFTLNAPNGGTITAASMTYTSPAGPSNKGGNGSTTYIIIGAVCGMAVLIVVIVIIVIMANKMKTKKVTPSPRDSEIDLKSYERHRSPEAAVPPVADEKQASPKPKSPSRSGRSDEGASSSDGAVKDHKDVYKPLVWYEPAEVDSKNPTVERNLKDSRNSSRTSLSSAKGRTMTTGHGAYGSSMP